MGLDNFFVMPYVRGLLRAILDRLRSGRSPPCLALSADTLVCGDVTFENEADSYSKGIVERRVTMICSDAARSPTTLFVDLFPLTGQLAFWDGSRYYGQQSFCNEDDDSRTRDIVEFLRSTAENIDGIGTVPVEVYGDPHLPYDVPRLKGHCMLSLDEVRAEVPDELVSRLYIPENFCSREEA